MERLTRNARCRNTLSIRSPSPAAVRRKPLRHCFHLFDPAGCEHTATCTYRERRPSRSNRRGSLSDSLNKLRTVIRAYSWRFTVIVCLPKPSSYERSTLQASIASVTVAYQWSSPTCKAFAISLLELPSTHVGRVLRTTENTVAVATE